MPNTNKPMGKISVKISYNKYVVYYIAICQMAHLPKFLYDNKLINKIAFKVE